MISNMHIIDHNLKVVITIRILTLKALCSPPKKIPNVNKRNLLLGIRLRCTWSNKLDCKFLGHPIRI